MSRPRRVRVYARPKERARRARLAAAAAATAVLAGVCAVTVRHMARRAAWPSPAALARPSRTTVEAPEPLRAAAQAAADAVEGGAGEKAQAVREAFPCVADVRVRRDWAERSAVLELVLRAPVARAARRGRPAGFLGEDGTVFAAPEGLFALSGALVEAEGAPPEELKSLAREWAPLSAPGALPARLLRASWKGGAGGWSLELSDGTSVDWGRLDWTGEKLSRLAAAVADARRREEGLYSADLRWFEDGKVLLRPAGLRR